MRDFFLEQWITAYLQIISGLLIFTVGVSALILQIAVPAYLRQLMKRRHISQFTLVILALYLSASVILIAFGLAEDSLPQTAEFIANALMIFLLLATVFYALRQLRQIDSSRFINALRNESIVDIRKRHQFDDTLETLIDLGRQSSAGYEKQRVLEALEQLAVFTLEYYRIKPSEASTNWFARIWKSDTNNQAEYKNGILSPIITGLEIILTESQTHGSVENFRTAQRALELLIIWLTRDPRTENGSDLEAAIQLTGRLAVFSMNHFQMNIQTALLRTLETSFPTERYEHYITDEVLYTVGLAALRIHNYQICVDILNAMLGWGDPDPIEANGSKHLLGLMAHLWTENQAAKESVENLLQSHGYRFKDGLQASIAAARTAHFAVSNFDTCVCLDQFAQEIVSSAHSTPRNA